MTVAEVTPASFDDDGFASGNTLSIMRTVGAGNYAAAQVTQGYGGGTVPTLTFTDDQATADGASWGAMLDTQANVPHGQYGCQFVRDKPFGSSASTTFTVTSSDSDGGKAICVREVSGTSGPDVHGGNAQDTPGTGIDDVTSGTITASAQPYLLLGFALDVPGNVNPETGTGFTSSGTGWGFGGSPDGATAENVRVTSAGAKAATFSTLANETIFTWAIAFLEAGGGTTFFHSVSVSVTTTVGVSKQVNPAAKSVAVGATLAASKQIGVTKSIATTTTLNGQKQVCVLRSIATTTTLVASRALALARRFAAAVTTTLSTSKQVNASKSIATTTTLGVAKQVDTSKSVAITTTVNESALKVKLVAVSVAVTATLALVKQVGVVRSVSVAATLATSRLLSLFRTISAAVTTTLGVSKQVNTSKSIAVTGSQSVATLKVKLVSVAVAVAASLSVSKQVGKVVPLAIGVSLNLQRAFFVTRTVAVSVAMRFASLVIPKGGLVVTAAGRIWRARPRVRVIVARVRRRIVKARSRR